MVRAVGLGLIICIVLVTIHLYVYVPKKDVGMLDGSLANTDESSTTRLDTLLAHTPQHGLTQQVSFAKHVYNTLSSQDTNIQVLGKCHLFKSKKWAIVPFITAQPLSHNLVDWCQNSWNVLTVPHGNSLTTWSCGNASEISTYPDFHSCKNREQCAYLYAIMCGAEKVVKIHQNTPFHDFFDSTTEVTTNARLTLPGPDIINPFVHYASCSAWSKGFPLDKIDWEETKCNLHYAGGRWVVKRPLQHVLHSHDLDTSWHVANFNVSSVNIQLQSDHDLAVSIGTFAPFDAANTLYFKSAFWSLFQISDVPESWASILHNYWTQTLLWLLESHVGFPKLNINITPPRLTKLQLENELISLVHQQDQLGKLVQFLRKWTCMFASFSNCMLQLGQDMARQQFWSNKTMEDLEMWVSDLQALNYSWPTLSKSNGPHALAYTAPLSANVSLLEKDRVRLFWQSRYKCNYHSLKNNKPEKFLNHVLPEEGPYLSIILTINNVDSQGNHFRLSHFLKVLADNTRQYKLHHTIELIIVDYNPDLERPNLFNAPSITWPPRADLPLIRVLRIPGHVHETILQAMQSPVQAQYFEFIAKNAAIRRACGDYIVTLNADSWLSPAFWEMLGHKSLSDNYYYRIGRLSSSVELPADSLSWSQVQIGKFMFDHNSGAFGMGPVKFYTNNRITSQWLSAPLKAPFFKDEGHVPIIAAPGDFTMMHRDAWFHMRGHPEVPLIGMIDDFVVWLAVAMGLRAATFNAPIAMYHMFHTSRQYTVVKDVLE